MSLEFRVRWQREGRRATIRIYQTWNPACRKVRGLLALEDIKCDFSRYDDMPDLVGPPVLEVREVGEWCPSEYQPQASDYDRLGMRDHARWHEPAEPDTEVPF
jgi:hypothetical protein